MVDLHTQLRSMPTAGELAWAHPSFDVWRRAHIRLTPVPICRAQALSMITKWVDGYASQSFGYRRSHDSVFWARDKTVARTHHLATDTRLGVEST